MENVSDSTRRHSTGLSAARAYEMVRRELLSEMGAEFFGSYVEQMRLVAEWTHVYERYWNEKLDAFEGYFKAKKKKP